MSDFDPVTIFYILYESMGAWLWVLMGLALVLLLGVISSFMKLRRAGRPALRSIGAALAVGLIAAAVLTLAVPIWTLADPSSLSAPVDYAVAFLLALVPSGIVASLVFMLTARRGAARSAIAPWPGEAEQRRA